MNTEVIYVSGTGNTAAVAKEIFQALPSSPKDIQELDRGQKPPLRRLLFHRLLGQSWHASVEVLDFLSELHGKKVAFFGTCGMGNSPEYYAELENKVRAFLPDDNEYFGSFFCQGKMPIRVREKYEAMLGTEHDQLASRLIKNFDEALFHPSAEDFRKAASFAKNISKKMEAVL